MEQIPGIRRIRFMTSHPKDLSDELIQVMAESKKICRHFHLPLQSGSKPDSGEDEPALHKGTVYQPGPPLKGGGAGDFTDDGYYRGLPGETEEDFEETLDVFRQVEFDSAFTFIYSKRTGTPGASMEDQVPEDVVKERFDLL